MQRPSYRRFVEIEEDDQVPVLRDDEEVLFRLDGVEVAFIKEHPLDDILNIVVTNMRLVIIGDKFQYDFDIPYITLHAVTRDPESYPKPCLYCQLDAEEDYDDDFGGNAEEASDEDEEEADEEGAKQKVAIAVATSDITTPEMELFVAPSSEEDLRSLFDALSRAALLNPDPPEDGDEEWIGDDDLIYNEEEVALGAAEAAAAAEATATGATITIPNWGDEDNPPDEVLQARLAYLESVFHVPEHLARQVEGDSAGVATEGQYADAETEERS